MPNLHRTLVLLLSTLLALPRPALAQARPILTSPAFAAGAPIAANNACTGADQSPALAWSNAPQATKSFALIVEDPDAPGGTFIHWIAFNISARFTSIRAGVPQTAKTPDGIENGTNSFGRVGYNGPCPPPGQLHHYRFRLFALDSTLNIGDNADAGAVEAAIKGHVLATAELVGTFQR